MTRRAKKLVTHFLIVAALVFSGHAIAQEAASPEGGVRTATIKEMQIAGSYVYILAIEDGKEVWLSTSPGFVKDINYGDVVEFFGEVEMQNFHSKGLNRTFESLWFISKIRVKQSEEGTTD